MHILGIGIVVGGTVVGYCLSVVLIKMLLLNSSIRNPGFEDVAQLETYLSPKNCAGLKQVE